MTGWTTALVLALQAASARLEEPQDPDRPALSAVDLAALRGHNIFSPPRPPRRTEPSRREERRSEASSAPAAPPRPRAPVVTGIYLDLSSGVHVAVLEDRNEDRLRQFREPRPARPGDAIGDFRVEAVEPDRLVLKRGEQTVTLRVGDALPDGAAPAPAAAPASDGASPQDVLERIRKRIGKNRSVTEEEPR
jgi:hypothetical protein